MNKDLVIGLLIVVIIFGIGYYNAHRTEMVSVTKLIFVKENNTFMNMTNDKCLNISSSGKRDLCYMSLFNIGKNDTATCDKLSDFNLKIMCYQTAARVTKNPEICVSLVRDTWRDECYRGVAIAMKNPVICGGIISPDIRAVCFSTVSLKGLDPFQVCTQIQIIENKAECFAAFQNRT